MADQGELDKEQVDRLRREIEHELRRSIGDELRVSIRRQIGEDVRARTREEVLQEIAARAPSDEERERLLGFVKELELDCYAEAQLASDLAEGAERDLAAWRRFASPATYALVLGGPLGTYALAQLIGSSSGAFLAAVATLILCLMVLVTNGLKRSAALGTAAKRNFKMASDFLVVAERAKAYRMLHAERPAEAVDLAERVEELREAREKLDVDFHPSLTQLEAARDAVRHRLEVGRPLRVDDDEPPEPSEEPAPLRARRRE